MRSHWLDYFDKKDRAKKVDIKVMDVKQESLVEDVNGLNKIKSSDSSEVKLKDFKLCAKCKSINLINFTKCHVCGKSKFIDTPSFWPFTWWTGLIALLLVTVTGTIGVVGFIVFWICIILSNFNTLKENHENKIRPLKKEAEMLLYRIKNGGLN